VQTCELGRQIEQVRFDGARETCEIIRNQDRLAAENERLVLQGRIDFERDRVGELRLALAEKEARILHQETLNAIGRSDCQLNGRIDQLGGVLDHRLTRIEDKMLKKPPFFAAGGVPLVSGVIPTGFRGFPPFAEAVV
jgi:hypothetical protein